MFDRQADMLTTAKLGTVIRAFMETSDIAYDTVYYSGVFLAEKNWQLADARPSPASLRLRRCIVGTANNSDIEY